MINYDLSKIKAIIFDVDGVLSAETIVLSATGEPLRTINIKDGYAIQLAIKMGLRIAILTGGNTAAVRKRYEGLGVTDMFMGASVKRTVYHEFLSQYDIPDYEVMRECGCACCPADAATDIKAIATYVSQRRGGEGVGRDVIEQVLRAQGKWLADEKAFGW